MQVLDVGMGGVMMEEIVNLRKSKSGWSVHCFIRNCVPLYPDGRMAPSSEKSLVDERANYSDK